MKEIIFFISLSISCNAVHAQSVRPTWRGIIPLYSTKADFEMVINDMRIRNDGRYENDNEIISISYASEPCVGKGWNVPSGVVLEYTLFPGKNTLIDKSSEDLISTSDDSGRSYKTDRANGIQYLVDAGGIINFIRYTPKGSDSKFRCIRFPKYDPVTETYLPYDRILLKNKSSLFSAASILSQLQASPGYSAYIFLYLAKGVSAIKGSRYLSDLQGIIARARSKEKTRVYTAVGGYRDVSEIEIYLLPSNYPRPVSSPKYPSE